MWPFKSNPAPDSTTTQIPDAECVGKFIVRIRFNDDTTADDVYLFSTRAEREHADANALAEFKIREAAFASAIAQRSELTRFPNRGTWYTATIKGVSLLLSYENQNSFT